MTSVSAGYKNTYRNFKFADMGSQKVQSSLDDLVEYTSLCKAVPTIFQGTILPFLFIYPVVFYSWIFIYGFDENFEAGFVTVAAVALVQILTCLCCYWSVHIQCFLSCSSVSSTALNFPCRIKSLGLDRGLANFLMKSTVTSLGCM